MSFTRAGACGLALLVAPGADSIQSQVSAPAAPGVVVETASLQGDVRSGDILHRWVRAPRPPSHPAEARGEINSPFDLYTVEREHGQRGIVTLHGSRGQEPVSVEMPSGESALPTLEWQVSVRPQMSASALAAYREGLRLISAKRPLDAARRWKQLAAEADDERSDLAVWLFYSAGKVLSDARLVPDAVSYYRDAERLAVATKRPVVAALIANAAGRVLEDSGDALGASDSQSRAVALLSSARHSMLLSRVLIDLGNADYRRGDLRLAERSLERAVRIREELSPGTRGLATALNNMAVLARETGAPARAHALNRRALEILETLVPQSPQVASVLNNAGGAALDAGDLEGAEGLFRRALTIRERLEPGGRAMALNLLNLGVVSKRRGDLDGAHHFYSRALDIFLIAAPASEEVEAALMNLGGIAFERGDFAEDEALLRRALVIAQRSAPGTLREASILHNLGVLTRERKDLAAATALFQQALHIAEKTAPGGRQSALYLGSLAVAVRDSGDLKQAESLYRRSLALWRRIAPRTDAEARASYQLATVLRRTGRIQEAVNLFDDAVTALEASAGRLGGDDETRSRFGAARREIYADYVDLLHQLDQDARAFHVLERSRASSLLRMLAERDVLWADLPADIVRERQLLNAEYDRTQARVAALDPLTERAALEQAAARLRELRAQRERLVHRVRKASAKTASIQYPQPLALEEARRALDRGTVLLSYSVGSERTLLFVVRPGPSRSTSIQVLTVPVTSENLRQEVARFRSTIERQLGDPHVAAGRRLYDVLIAPAEELIAPAERVLIAPDGPLHSLPFSALVRPDHDTGGTSNGPRYFVAWKPLHVILSATVYAEVAGAPRRIGSSNAVVAFGDPVLPASSAKAEAAPASDAGLSTLVRRGNELESLPSSRREVARIAALYPTTSSAYLAADATEERVKQVGGRARYLHFATHGLLDERFPLDSGLVLTRATEGLRTGRENGLLQAWEIFDHLRLNAELVVLSACETALGAELGGEGLVGLSRAFQYAGARSVLASLWRVADESTADLMERFYRHLKAGQSKDVSLRDAQMELMRSRAAAHPFHWAAFTLSGDWKDRSSR